MAEDRHEIEVRLKDGWSPYRIAKHLGRAYNTVKGEIARGTVYLYNGKVPLYKANECHNKVLRRFIPKRRSMSRYKAEDIAFMADWANALPRKILGYRTPDELFEVELDHIYAISAAGRV